MDRLTGSGLLSDGMSVGRRQFLRGAVATSAIAGAGGLLAACSSGSDGTSAKTGVPDAAQTRRRGGSLKLGLSGGSSDDTMDPHAGVVYIDYARINSVYQPLVFLNNQAEIQYGLAEKIEPRDKKATEWLIHLRQGIKFHDGKPFTADDVIFSLARAQKNNAAAALATVDAKGLKALDANTVLVPMTSPFGRLVEQLAAFFFDLYMAPVSFDPSKPNGTGPFVFQSFTPGARSVFTRNKNYWKSGLPYVDTLEIIDFSDNVSLQNALVTDVVQGAGALDPQQIAALSSTKGVTAVAAKAGGFLPFTMRLDQAPFTDVRVRQAMRLLVDRQQMIDSALGGYATLASDVFSPYDPDFDKSLQRHVDIPQAKFLLKQAGQSDLTVQMTTSAIASGTIAMATVLSEQARAAGVTIKLNQVDPGTFFGDSYLSWNFSQDYYPYLPYLSQLAYSIVPGSPFNECHLKDAQYLSLYQQANETSSVPLRKEIESKLQEYDFNNGGYIIPAFSDSLDAYSDKIIGYSPAKVGEPLSNFDFEHFSFV